MYNPNPEKKEKKRKEEGTRKKTEDRGKSSNEKGCHLMDAAIRRMIRVGSWTASHMSPSNVLGF